MPNDVNKPPPDKGAGDEAYKALAADKGLPLDEGFSPKEAAFFKQLKETTGHATTPDTLESEATRTHANTPDFDPTAPAPQVGGGPPPTVPPKEPPSGGGGASEGGEENSWSKLLKELFASKLFVSVVIGLLFMIVGYTANYLINAFNNSPESMERQKNHILLLKELQEVQDKNASRSIFASTPAMEKVSAGCVVTAQDRTTGNFARGSECNRIKYEQMRNDPGMYFDFGKGQRISSIEGRYRLLNGRELLCQTENPSEEKFSTDGCTSVLADKRLTSIGLAPLNEGGIIVSFTKQ